ncbi:MAG: HD domain-containing protein [Oligoflexia bacterium]|nr:HD domain-containing protein [Oligoflexia bacterium]
MTDQAQDPSKKSEKGFFSVPFDFVVVGEKLPYDLYVNSSSRPEHERFVRVFPKDELMDRATITKMRSKYFQIYVIEDQRAIYLNSLVKSDQVSDENKTKVIKDSAINYLAGLVDHTQGFRPELLVETIDNCKEAVQSMVTVIKDYRVSDLHEMIAKLSFHDFYTYDHSINVSMYCVTIYKTYKQKILKESVSDDELITIGMGGLLHDLGKLKLPTSILNNPGKLSVAEFEEVKQHPRYGLEMLNEARIRMENRGKQVDFDTVSKMIYEHHENFDSSGYPQKLKGDTISESARITAIADFFDAITTKRSYSEVLSLEAAIDVMGHSRGKKIDPNLFAVFLTSLKKLSLPNRNRVEVPADFDPSQPHEKIPLIEVSVSKPSANFGKVVVQEDNQKKDKEKK